jgi:WD40 repeat protein
VRLDLKPDAKAWDLKPGSPLNPASLVIKPAAIKGLRSWTLETCDSRGDSRGNATGQLSPDNHLYATVGRDGVIRFLDPATGKLEMALVNPELDLTALTWSPDSGYLAVGCAKGLVRIWNVAKGAPIIGPTSSSTNQVSSLAWSPDGTRLAIAHLGESAVVLWDVREAKQRPGLQESADDNRSVNFLAWSADGKQLMVTTDLALRIWNVAGARLVQSLDSQNPNDREPRRAAAWSPDGKQIATLCGHSVVKFFDATYKLVMTGQAGLSFAAPPLRIIAWSPDGRQLACTCFRGCVVMN